jgi:hypothetical protein
VIIPSKQNFHHPHGTKKKLIDTRWPLAQTFGNLVGQSPVKAPFLLVNLPFAPPESPVSPNMIIGFD